MGLRSFRNVLTSKIHSPTLSPPSAQKSALELLEKPAYRTAAMGFVVSVAEGAEGLRITLLISTPRRLW